MGASSWTGKSIRKSIPTGIPALLTLEADSRSWCINQTAKRSWMFSGKRPWLSSSSREHAKYWRLAGKGIITLPKVNMCMPITKVFRAILVGRCVPYFLAHCFV